jgi:hypothetical protein
MSTFALVMALSALHAWLEGLWANAGHPSVLPIQPKIG